MKYTIGQRVNIIWLSKTYPGTIISITDTGYKVLLEDGTIIPRVGEGDAQWANVLNPIT